MDLTLPHETIEISALLPKVQAALIGVDQNLASEYLMSAAIDFATETRIMRMTRCITIIACVNSYHLDVSPYKITEVAKISVEGSVCSGNTNASNLCHVEGTTIYVDDQLCKDSGATLLVELVVSPKRSGVTIPEDLYEDWEPAIVSGALSELYLMGGAAWADKGLSDRHALDFVRSTKRARFLHKRRHKPVSLRLSPKRRSR